MANSETGNPPHNQNAATLDNQQTRWAKESTEVSRLSLRSQWYIEALAYVANKG